MRVLSAVGALALAAVGAVGLSSPAQAAEGHYPVDGWSLIDTTISSDVDWSDCDPGPSHTQASASKVQHRHAVNLTKPAGDVGTSIETTDLGLSGDVVSVDYALSGGASFLNGAVRVFVYDHTHADTDCTAPAASAVADADSGTLTLQVPFDGPIGSMGLVYDASNDSAGTVTFSNLRVDSTPVLFLAPNPTEPSDEPSQEPSDKPSEKPSEAPSGAGGGGGKELPKTGFPLDLAVLGASVLVGFGVWLVWAGRRQRWLLDR